MAGAVKGPPASMQHPNSSATVEICCEPVVGYWMLVTYTMEVVDEVILDAYKVIVDGFKLANLNW